MPAPAHAQAPLIVIISAWFIAALPAAATMLYGLLPLWSFITGTGANARQALQFMPFVAMYLAAVLTTVAIRRCATSGRAWLWAGATVVLLLAASTPLTVAAGKAVAEEWCEGQPGGRGYGNIQSLDQIPRICR